MVEGRHTLVKASTWRIARRISAAGVVRDQPELMEHETLSTGYVARPVGYPAPAASAKMRTFLRVFLGPRGQAILDPRW
jgi:hypothetical protein